MSIYRKIHIPDQLTSRAFDAVGAAFDALTSRFYITERTITADIAAAGNTTIRHQLGRVPRGWRVLDASPNPASLGRVSWDATTITLSNAGSATTVKLELL